MDEDEAPIGSPEFYLRIARAQAKVAEMIEESAMRTEDDILERLKEMRIPDGTTLRFTLDYKTFEFTAEEWNRILDLAKAGLEGKP